MAFCPSLELLVSTALDARLSLQVQDLLHQLPEDSKQMACLLSLLPLLQDVPTEKIDAEMQAPSQVSSVLQVLHEARLFF